MFRIMKRTFWCTLNKERLGYYYIEKKCGPFWFHHAMSFDTVEEARNYLKPGNADHDEIIEVIK